MVEDREQRLGKSQQRVVVARLYQRQASTPLEAALRLGEKAVGMWEMVHDSDGNDRTQRGVRIFHSHRVEDLVGKRVRHRIGLDQPGDEFLEKARTTSDLDDIA